MAHRTTLSLADDVWAELRRRAAEADLPVKVVVDSVLRRGLRPPDREDGSVELATFAGELLVDVSSTSRAFEQAEGADHR